MGFGEMGQLSTEEGVYRLRTSPAYRRGVWAIRLMLLCPFLMALSAVGAAVLSGPVQFVRLGCTFGLALVAVGLGWSSILPLSRTLRSVLPDHPRDVFGAPVGIPTTLLREVFRRAPVRG
jgi:hypothetical protein